MSETILICHVIQNIHLFVNVQIILGQKISFGGSPHKHCLIKMALEHIYLIAIG